MLETAGTIDMDIEIKFSMGGVAYSIDVSKIYRRVKDLYKTLFYIGTMQRENAKRLQHAHDSLQTASQTVNRSTGSSSPAEQFQAINQYSFDWLTRSHDTYLVKDFGDVFEKFIKN